MLDDDGPQGERREDREPRVRAGDDEAIWCAACGARISDRGSLFTAPGSETPTRVFANPHGKVFEVLTLRRAERLVAFGRPTSDFTWFAGYAWTVVLCAGCAAHLGWAFHAANSGHANASGDVPNRFFALVREAIRGA